MDRANGRGFLGEITPLIITFNEIDNISRTLGKLNWASRVIIVDSGSSDGTLEILQSHPQVDVFHRPFDTFADQCNFGLRQIHSDWVLSLDADYELSDQVLEEINRLRPTDDISGYACRFVYKVLGQSLRASLYPPRVILYRKAGAQYRNEGHGHRVSVQGPVHPLREVVYHDDRKPLSRWLASQQAYAKVEAAYLEAAKNLSWRDRIRKMAWPAPGAVFLYTLFVKGCILDGWPGWFYALQRLLAEMMLALELINSRLAPKDVAVPREH